MRIVSNEYAYWAFIRELRNDPRVNSGFIQGHEIKLEEHVRHMIDFGDTFRVCLYANKPAGYVRVNEDNDISVCVHPDYQKKGVGAKLIEYVCETNAFAIAKVKVDNDASVALFEKCGFKKKYFIMEQE